MDVADNPARWHVRTAIGLQRAGAAYWNRRNVANAVVGVDVAGRGQCLAGWTCVGVTKVATKSDSGPITEVTDESSARSCDPPHPYTKNAPTAQKFSDQRCKRTFATVSPQLRTLRCIALNVAMGHKLPRAP